MVGSVSCLSHPEVEGGSITFTSSPEWFDSPKIARQVIFQGKEARRPPQTYGPFEVVIDGREWDVFLEQDSFNSSP